MFGHNVGSRTRSRRARRRGIMLLEALCGLFITALLVVHALSLMMRSTSGVDGARQTAIAYNVARSQVERLRMFQGTPLSDRTNAPLIGGAPELAALNGGVGTLTVQTYRAPVKKVSVKIRWVSANNGAPRSVCLTTLMTPGGLNL